MLESDSSVDQENHVELQEASQGGVGVYITTRILCWVINDYPLRITRNRKQVRADLSFGVGKWQHSGGILEYDQDKLPRW